jgi:hypothetical protein
MPTKPTARKPKGAAKAKQPAAKKPVARPAARKSAKPAAKKPAAKAAARPAKKAVAASAKKPAAVEKKPAKPIRPVAKARHTPGTEHEATERTASPGDTYTLDNVVARLGAANEAEVLRVVQIPAEELIEIGATVATDRIGLDSARLFGFAADFLAGATKEQKAALLGVTPDFLRIGAWAAHRDLELWKQRRAQLAEAAGSKKVAEAGADALRRRARGRREQLRAALLLASGGTARRRAEVMNAYGTLGERGEALGESLRSLSQLARAYLSSRDPDVKNRALAAGLTLALLNETAALAMQADSEREDASAPRAAGATVPQRDVDRWDGLSLTLLSHLIDLFEAAHLADPSIPKLQPISLRTFFSPVRAKKPAPDAPKPDPSRLGPK